MNVDLPVMNIEKALLCFPRVFIVDRYYFMLHGKFKGTKLSQYCSSANVATQNNMDKCCTLLWQPEYSNVQKAIALDSVHHAWPR